MSSSELVTYTVTTAKETLLSSPLPNPQVQTEKILKKRPRWSKKISRYHSQKFFNSSNVCKQKAPFELIKRFVKYSLGKTVVLKFKK